MGALDVVARATRRLRPLLGTVLHRDRTAPAPSSPGVVVAAAYAEALGREPDDEGLATYVGRVRAGASSEDVVRELAASREGVVHAARALGLHVDERSDTEFLQDLYRAVLEREADRSGLSWLGGLLADGHDRLSVALLLAGSEESLNRQLAARSHIQDLRELRPASFHRLHRDDGSSVEVFSAEGPDDVDWMESAVLEHGYYEKPGIWSLALDDDKRRMGALLGTFRPARALEIGCSSGTVLSALAERGVRAEGLEISRMAIQRADPAIRGSILRGDLLEVDLEPGYDLVFGLDLFEHLNPNRLDAYLARLAEVLDPDGFVFVNSPAFGPDPVWGTIFPLELEQWREDAEQGRTFRHWPVDEDGYPAHGHLVWAAPAWWTELFARAGFHRQEAVERAVHRVHDPAFEAESLARKAFFVFSLSAQPRGAADVVARFEALTG